MSRTGIAVFRDVVVRSSFDFLEERRRDGSGDRVEERP